MDDISTLVSYVKAVPAAAGGAAPADEAAGAASSPAAAKPVSKL
jgi:hypothetical protein